MSYEKEDFIIMTDDIGNQVIINIPKITFVVQYGEICRIFFGGFGEDDYLTVKATIDDFMEIL